MNKLYFSLVVLATFCIAFALNPIAPHWIKLPYAILGAYAIAKARHVFIKNKKGSPFRTTP